jgi:hypothetical protein
MPLILLKERKENEHPPKEAKEKAACVSSVKATKRQIIRACFVQNTGPWNLHGTDKGKCIALCVKRNYCSIYEII